MWNCARPRPAGAPTSACSPTTAGRAPCPAPLGSGTVYIGRQAVNQGYDTVRISSHELGHILGLPDRKPGPCSSLMSGSSAGVSCTNPYPNAAEKAEVEENFSASVRASVPAVRSAAVGG